MINGWADEFNQRVLWVSWRHQFIHVFFYFILAVTDNKNSGETRRAPSTMSSKKHQRVDKEPASKPQSEATEPLFLLDTTFTTSNARGNATVKIKWNDDNKKKYWGSEAEAERTRQPVRRHQVPQFMCGSSLTLVFTPVRRWQTATRSTRRKKMRGGGAP